VEGAEGRLDDDGVDVGLATGGTEAEAGREGSGGSWGGFDGEVWVSEREGSRETNGFESIDRSVLSEEEEASGERGNDGGGAEGGGAGAAEVSIDEADPEEEEEEEGKEEVAADEDEGEEAEDIAETE
jgi:hypothetical protein